MLATGPARSKVERFYQGLISGEFKSDQDAANVLYDNNPNHPAYVKLKNRLFEKLLMQIFLLDISGIRHSKETNAYFESFIYFSCNRILSGLDELETAFVLAQKGIRKALKYNMAIPGFLLSKSNLYLAKNTSDYIKNYYTFEKLSDYFFKSMQIELEISEIKETLIINLAKGGLSNKLEADKIINKLTSFEKDLSKLSRATLTHYYYALALALLLKNNFKDVIKTCDSGLKKLTKAKTSVVHILNLLKSQCHLHLNQFEDAKKELEKGRKKLLTKEINQIAFLEIDFLIYIRTGNIENALKIFELEFSYSNSKANFHISNESWRQYGLLLLFLIKLDKIPPSDRLERLKPKLRLGKLLNEMPEYSKDKAGLNLAIRILHVLILLTSKKFEEFEEALVPLQSYIQRYKRHHPEIFRCDLMVKMLSLIPRVHYDAARTSWRARPFLEKMLVPPEQLPLKVTEMEVIPYEKMWEYVIEFLGTLKRRPYSSKAGD